MFNLSRKEITTGLIVTVIGGLILILVNEKIKNWFDPEKVEVTNLPPQKDTLFVKPVGNEGNGGVDKPDTSKGGNNPGTLPITEPIENKAGNENRQEEKSSKSEFIADYLISSAAANQLEDILPDIQTVVEQAGNSAVVNSSENTSFQNLRGKYNKLILVLVKLTFNSSPNVTDSRTVSTSYSYSIKSYDVNTAKLFKPISNNGVQPGFTKDETIQEIRKKIIQNLKTQL